jgi:hypothetical protein
MTLSMPQSLRDAFRYLSNRYTTLIVKTILLLRSVMFTFIIRSGRLRLNQIRHKANRSNNTKHSSRQSLDHIHSIPYTCSPPHNVHDYRSSLYSSKALFVRRGPNNSSSLPYTFTQTSRFPVFVTLLLPKSAVRTRCIGIRTETDSQSVHCITCMIVNIVLNLLLFVPGQSLLFVPGQNPSVWR